MAEMPEMVSLQYSSSTSIPGHWGTTSDGTTSGFDNTSNITWVDPNDFKSGLRQKEADFGRFLQLEMDNDELEDDDEMADTPTRRLVKVFMADPDTNIPLEDCLLYSGEEQLTDLTDEELFFEIPVKELLDKHNLKRVKIEKETPNSDKTEFLKKVRIRDLRMTVVTIAQF